MFQGDVRFSRQGSVLINVTSIFRVGILVSSGIPHEFLFIASCSDVALLDIVVPSCIILGHPSRPTFSISVCCSFALGFFTGLSVLFWLLFPVLDE